MSYSKAQRDKDKASERGELKFDNGDKELPGQPNWSGHS